MRKTEILNQGWRFTGPDKREVPVDLPHTWNAVDGQDGGNDYWRGTCTGMVWKCGVVIASICIPVQSEGSTCICKGVGKLSKVSADDKSLFFGKVTGVENEAISDENMKYMGMNEAGQLIVCYSEDNMVKKNGDVAFAFIFVRVE